MPYKYENMINLLAGLVTSMVSLNIYLTIFTSAQPKLICNTTTNKTTTCQEWSLASNSCYFDTTHYGRTIVTDFGLVCDRSYLSSITQSIFMIGSLTSIFSGSIGDLWGRKRSLIGFATLLCFVLVLAQVLQLNVVFNLTITQAYVVYCISQFLIGLLTASCYGTVFVLLIEIDRRRSQASIINYLFFVFGEIVLLIFAFFIRDWKAISWFATFYTIFITILIIVFLPESPKWLMVNKRYDEARKLFDKISRINKTKKDFDETIIMMTDGKNQNVLNIFKDIFYPCKKVLKFFSLSFIFISIILLYFGISYGMTSLNVDPYLLYVAAAIAEVFGYLISKVNDKIGRRLSNIIFMVLSGVSCLIIGFLPLWTSATSSIAYVLTIIFTSLGKCVISAAMNNISIYVNELYTTSSRGTAALMLSGLSRIGGLAAPMILLLASTFQPLPYLIFGLCSLLATFFTFFLPETLNKSLE